MITRNYDLSSLAVEVDLRGWILGESALGATVLGDTGGDWTDIRAGFQQIRLQTSVAIDSAALCRPEAGTIDLVTRDLSQLDNLYNKTIRVKYGSTVLGRAIVKIATVDADPNPDDRDDHYQVTIRAVGSTSALNRVRFTDFSAPEETATARAERIYPAVICTDLPARLMPAVGPIAADVLSLLQACSDVATALFVVDELDQVQLAADHFPYRGGSPRAYSYDESTISSLSLEQSIDNVTTAWLVRCASDATKQVEVKAVGAAMSNEQQIDVDCVPTLSAVTAIAKALPRGVTAPVAPTSLTPAVDWRGASSIDRPRLLDTVTAVLGGASYDGAVIGVSDVITPRHWDTVLTLAPAGILDRTDTADAPGPVSALRTTARTINSISLAWKAPQAVGSATGYVVRRAAGSVAPASPTAGTSVGGGVLPLSTLSVVDSSGLSSMSDYSYAVFVVTADPAIYSPRVTTSTWTTPRLPTPALSLSWYGSLYPRGVTVSWTATSWDTFDWLVVVKDNVHALVSSSTPAAAVRLQNMVAMPGTNYVTVTARRTFHGITYTASATDSIYLP